MTDLGLYVLIGMVTIVAVSIGLFMRWESASIEWTSQAGLDCEGIERYSSQMDESSVLPNRNRSDSDCEYFSGDDPHVVP